MRQFGLFTLCLLFFLNGQAATEHDHQHNHNAAESVPERLFSHDEALAISQAALDRQMPDVTLTRTNGNPLKTSDLLGKPVVISFIYTSCYHICPTTTQHLHTVFRKARAALGTSSFTMLTIGFDVVKDTPEMMQFFADQQRISESDWHFLSADQATIDKLTEALGFIYFPSPNGFDHLIQATILDEQGLVFRQVYGMKFDTPLLIEPLKQLVFDVTPEDNLLDIVANQVKLFCTVYDPSEDKYKFDYSLFIGMFIGFMCVGLLGFQLTREWRKTLSS